jgi:hypothetical protein
MKTKSYNLGAMLAALLASVPALAADPPPQQPPQQPPQTTPGGPAGVVPPPGVKGPLPEVLPTPPSPVLAPRPDGLPPGSVTSPWIDYSRPDCCGSIGGGPIGSEFFLRAGPSIPLTTGILHEALDTGWFTEIGARTLFFNQPATLAWTVEAGLSYTISNSGKSDLTFQAPFLIPVTSTDPNTGTQIITPTLSQVLVTIRDYQRWSFNLALGREWYILRPAYEPGWHWRMGWDIGGRWGYGRLELNDLSTLPDHIGFRHTSDVYGSLALSLHEDIEIPLKNCVSFIAGIRGEWVYNWTDVVPPEAGRDLQDINIMFNFGWRY